MLPPELARAGITIAVFIILVAGALLPFLDRSSPEFFLTTFCLVLGLVFGAGVWYFAKRRPR